MDYFYKTLLFVTLTVAVRAETCATDGSSAKVSTSTITLGSSTPGTRIQSSGCPPWDWSGQTTPGTAQVINLDVKIPQTPVMAKSPLKIGRTDLAVKGIVGIMLNGVGIFNDGDATNGDAYINEGKTMDSCNGHVAINTYHTHTLPGGCCAYTETGKTHSPFWAVMADGIPVAGPLGDNGAIPSNLDECRGHTDSTHPFYHYHTTSELKAPYIVGCLKGCVFNNFGNAQLNNYVTTPQSCQKADKQYNYSSMKLNWDASPVKASTIKSCAYKYRPGETPTSAPSGQTPTPTSTPTRPPGGPPGGKMPGGKLPGRKMI